MSKLKETLEEILDSVWDEACDMMEDGGTPDISRKLAKEKITSLIEKEIIGEDEGGVVMTAKVKDIYGEEMELRVGNSQKEENIRNELRAEQRAKLKELIK